MTALERVAALMTLMRELGGVLRTETALLRDLKLDRLQALQLEKAGLAAAYERELMRLRTDPALVAELDEASRAALESEMRGFQLTLSGNARRIEAARQVVEGIVRTLGEAVAVTKRAPVYGRERERCGTVVSLTLDRQI